LRTRARVIGHYGLKAGQQIDGNLAHPARFLTTCMKAVGAGDPLGNVSGVIPAML
jgi:hypothetical protein